MTLLSIAAGSIYNSQGAISHHLQIVPLVLIAQTAAHFFDIFRTKRGGIADDPLRREARVVQWSQQAVVAVYLVSALTKLIHTSGAWILQSPMIVLQIIKTNDQTFYDTLDPALAGSGQALADSLADHPLLVGAVMTAGLLIELTSPLLLLGRAWALFYGIALLAFHQTVDRVMHLPFLHNQLLLVIFIINVPFWIVLAVSAGGRRATPAES
jgi:hypothetical protein